MKNTLYWIWLSMSLRAGSSAAVRLIRHFGDAGSVYRAGEKEFSGDCPVKDKRVLAKLSDKSLSEAERILRWCETSGVSVVCPEDKAYPKNLLQLTDAPMVLYFVGKMPDFSNHLAISVVGTRKMSDYGKKMAYSIGSGLGAGGAVLVSGMALGVDGMAMAGALDCGGSTVAVLGCGIDVVYPKEHKDLMRKVAETGAVITEYPPGTPPSREHFPVRNRIISGLCQGTVVVEGDTGSGALITARQAVYQGRDLYAVPGRIGDSGASGTNQLIKEGARAVTNAVDILQNYEFIYPNTVSIAAAVTAQAYFEDSVSSSADSAAKRMNISSSKSKNYYGKGTYGGKAESQDKKSADIKSVNKSDRKNSSEKSNKKSDRDDKKIFGSSVSESKHIDLDMLGEDELRVYNSMKPDVPTLPDEIVKAGIPISKVMASLTLLEISGAVEAGAGGYFVRSSADIDLVPGNDLK